MEVKNRILVEKRVRILNLLFEYLSFDPSKLFKKCFGKNNVALTRGIDWELTT